MCDNSMNPPGWLHLLPQHADAIICWHCSIKSIKPLPWECCSMGRMAFVSSSEAGICQTEWKRYICGLWSRVDHQAEVQVLIATTVNHFHFPPSSFLRRCSKSNNPPQFLSSTRVQSSLYSWNITTQVITDWWGKKVLFRGVGWGGLSPNFFGD